MSYFRMRRRLDGRVVEVTPLPSGLTLLPFTEETAKGSCALMTRVHVDGPGEIPFFAHWFGITMDEEYDPELVFLAADGDEVVGFCQCWTGNFIKDLAVDQTWRRRGLGTALLTRALSAFQSRGADYVDLKTDLDNKTAQSLYKRLGFIIVEEVLF